MKLMHIIPFALSAAVACAAPSPALTPVFTAVVELGKPVGPIGVDPAVEYTIIEPITGGKVQGAINGTILGGFAAPTISNQTTVRPLVEIYGESDDNVPFFVQATGVGIVLKQFAFLSVSVGGQYAYLEQEYILASFTDNNKHTQATIDAWVVSRS